MPIKPTASLVLPFAKPVRGRLLGRATFGKRAQAQLQMSSLTKLDQAGLWTVQKETAAMPSYPATALIKAGFGSFDDEDLVAKQR